MYATPQPKAEQVADREQLLVKSIEYEKAQAQKYFELYTQVCETAQRRLKEIARLESRLAEMSVEQEPKMARKVIVSQSLLRAMAEERQENRPYTAAPQPANLKGLTDEEIRHIIRSEPQPSNPIALGSWAVNICHAAIAAYERKNRIREKE